MFSEGIGHIIGGFIWVWYMSVLPGLSADAISQPLVNLGIAIGIGFVFWGVFLIAYGLHLRGQRSAKSGKRRSCRRTTASF